MTKFIFSINSGRSGSQYLSELLGTGKNVHSFHEHPPLMIDKYLYQINNDPYKLSYDDRRIKVNKIYENINKWPKDHIYAESNHMFIKTFYDVVCDEFAEDIKVVKINRPIEKVLASFIQLSYFDKNKEALKWMSRPDAKTAAIMAIKPYSQMTHYEKCIAYLIDIEARAERFKKEYPKIDVLEYNLSDLNNIDNVKNMFDKLEVIQTEKTHTVVGKAINQRTSRKKQFNINTNIQICKNEILKYIDQAKKAGIYLPRRIVNG